jgi:serine/threonine protein kinase
MFACLCQLSQAIREIKILRALEHENIVKLREMIVYDSSIDGEEYGKKNELENGDVFMVFQFCEYDLYGILRNNDAVSVYVLCAHDNMLVCDDLWCCCGQVLTPAHIKSYTQQLLNGVRYIHTNKILHRDIKSKYACAHTQVQRT